MNLILFINNPFELIDDANVPNSAPEELTIDVDMEIYSDIFFI